VNSSSKAVTVGAELHGAIASAEAAVDQPFSPSASLRLDRLHDLFARMATSS